MHPFDPRTALLAKHAQHVVLVHFPIALFVSGVGFDLCGQWLKRAGLADAAYFNFLIAAFATLPVVASGLLAWQWQLEGQRLKGILLMHLVFACLSSVMIWVVWWIHYRGRRGGGERPRYRIPLELLGVVLVALTGHLGGFLSGVNGMLV
ncbi:MAG: DUF2231 domain-containing protein [Candidatus Sulfotelmatobacter sp.]